MLNAKHHIAARRKSSLRPAGWGAVTIATNMAGRGTDIVLGGNPETMAWAQLQDKYPTRLEVPKDEWNTLVRQIEEREQMKSQGEHVKQLGGLHIIGTERHEARRIDLQLRGRCGRQGDPGSSRFYLSLEDDLMRIFAGEWVKNILTRLGMKEGEAIESRMVSKRIEGAQRKVEERNFDVRKNLLEYDEVMDEQRKRVYGYRQRILEGANCKRLILEMINEQIEHHLGTMLDPRYGVESFATWAGGVLSVELEPKDFVGMDFQAAAQFARDEAERGAEAQIFEAVEENLPEGEENEEWNWEAIAKLANTRWKTNFRDRDLKKAGRDGVSDLLRERAHEWIGKVDLSEGEKFLAEDFGVRSACGWVQHKFGFAIDPAEAAKLEPEAFKALIRRRAAEAYGEKETEFPVMVGLNHFAHRDASGVSRFDRDGLVAWARSRFSVDLEIEELRSKDSREIRALLIEKSRANQERAEAALAELHRRVAELREDHEPLAVATSEFAKSKLPKTSSNGAPVVGPAALAPVAAWLRETTGEEVPLDRFAGMSRSDLDDRLSMVLEDHFRSEMRRMERLLMLEILDTSWKDHLLAMDHLRSAVGLRGWAQIDPKVEYSREGMRTFEEMWKSIGARVTDLIYRMEQLDQGFVGSTWKETSATHDEARPVTEMAKQQQSALDASQTNEKIEPIRNKTPRVGRNDPCPCGSGK